jgi:hypothetical protein
VERRACVVVLFCDGGREWIATLLIWTRSWTKVLYMMNKTGRNSRRSIREVFRLFMAAVSGSSDQTSRPDTDKASMRVAEYVDI